MLLVGSTWARSSSVSREGAEACGGVVLSQVIKSFDLSLWQSVPWPGSI
jgi:hypothetical protein